MSTCFVVYLIFFSSFPSSSSSFRFFGVTLFPDAVLGFLEALPEVFNLCNFPSYPASLCPCLRSQDNLEICAFVEKIWEKVEDSFVISRPRMPACFFLFPVSSLLLYICATSSLLAFDPFLQLNPCYPLIFLLQFFPATLFTSLLP